MSLKIPIVIFHLNTKGKNTLNVQRNIRAKTVFGVVSKLTSRKIQDGDFALNSVKKRMVIARISYTLNISSKLKLYKSSYL